LKDTKNPEYMRGFQDAVELINDEIYKAKDLADAKEIVKTIHGCVYEFRLPLIAETVFYLPREEIKHPPSKDEVHIISEKRESAVTATT
jgi:hypothetical protein